MTTYNMPSGIKIMASNFGQEWNTRTFESPLTRETQRIGSTGERWFATYTLTAMQRPKAAEIQAFLMKLRGQLNTFYAYDPDAKTARGSAGTTPGTPRVKGASQTGNTLLVDGATASATGYLLEGDYFDVNGELKMIVSQADTDGSGEVTLTFEPALRSAPADNAVINFDTPTCIMMLADDKQSQWDADKYGVYSMTFTAIEVVNN